MKILLLGKNGQIGSELNSVLINKSEYKIHAITRKDCDLKDNLKLKKIIQDFNPDIVINAAAYTNVEEAENENNECLAINAEFPKYLANLCNENNIILIHYSTDYVFDGKKETSYSEKDNVNPINFYGKSKLLGEEYIKNILTRHIIIRTSWIYSRHGNNFLKTIAKLSTTKKFLSIIHDQYGVPTSASFIADMTTLFLRKFDTNINDDIYGTYHITPDGYTNWYNFSKKIIQYLSEHKSIFKISVDNIKAIETEEYPSKALRPMYSILDNNKFKLLFSPQILEWERYIKPVILEISENINNDENPRNT